MSPCSPNDNQLNVNPPPLPSVGGFGPPVSPIASPIPGFELPTELLSDWTDLMNKVGALFPSGLFKPVPDESFKSIYDFISSILTQIAPFLSFYNFIMAALKMITCVIDVICAIPNPFAMASKIQILFSQCIPAFLALFPFFALIAMIISLLLLILALILYIIQYVSDVIDSIIANLEIFANAIQLNDAVSSMAAARKIASLLCTIQNIIAIFIGLAAILAVVEALAKLSGFLICSDDDPNGCCPPDICPGFIKNTPNGIATINGSLKYFKEISFDSSSFLPPGSSFSVPPVRKETWQVWDDTSLSQQIYSIYQIIDPVGEDENIFYPDEQEYTKSTSKKRVPYLLDLRVALDPNIFGIIDPQNYRFFRIKNCIVVRKPYIGVREFNNDINNLINSTGTLNIEGGLVFEDDGETPYIINGKQATINNLIHQSSSTSTSIPGSDDSINFDIEFTWYPNAPALAGMGLTTIGCVPEVNLEKATLNSVILAEGIEPIAIKIPPAPPGEKVNSVSFLPNVSGTLACINNSLSEFRKNISVSTAADFKASTSICLNDLKNQTTSTICFAIIAAVSQFKSTSTIEPNLQFTSRPVKIIVDLKDATGTSLGTNIPMECISVIEEKISADVTFGKVSKFKYDGAQFFVAEITSDITGSGTVNISFEGKVFSTYTPSNPPITVSPTIVEQSLNYSFVATSATSPVRRDSTDIARDGE